MWITAHKQYWANDTRWFSVPIHTAAYPKQSLDHEKLELKRARCAVKDTEKDLFEEHLQMQQHTGKHNMKQ